MITCQASARDPGETSQGLPWPWHQPGRQEWWLPCSREGDEPTSKEPLCVVHFAPPSREA